MPDWYGTTGRDDLVGGGDATQFSTTIEDVTLCSKEPFTDKEREALGVYFRMLRKTKEESAEQQARELLELCGVEDAQSFSAGDVVALANLIADHHRRGEKLERIRKLSDESTEIDHRGRTWVYTEDLDEILNVT